MVARMTTAIWWGPETTSTYIHRVDGAIPSRTTWAFAWTPSSTGLSTFCRARPSSIAMLCNNDTCGPGSNVQESNYQVCEYVRVWHTILL